MPKMTAQEKLEHSARMKESWKQRKAKAKARKSTRRGAKTINATINATANPPTADKGAQIIERYLARALLAEAQLNLIRAVINANANLKE